MSTTAQIPADAGVLEARLANDERWLLVCRILASEGFQRAGQLRKILLYATRAAILEPERILHEYEIACDVLDRRPDFDPTSDNIVRAQFTHLRRKLERYFNDEGHNEPILLTIPRGSYIPQFPPNSNRPTITNPAISYGEKGVPSTSLDEPIEIAQETEKAVAWWRHWTGIGMLVSAGTCVVLAILLTTVHKDTVVTAPDKLVIGNGFIPFLTR